MKRLGLAAIALLAATAPAFAHLSPNEHGSFMAGFSHPLFGLDHILVMVSVGIWAAMIGGRAIWVVPAAFVAMMAAGFGLSLAGVHLPFVEPAILASVVGLGLLIALAVRLPVTASALVVGSFALFHGHAHGGEIGAAGAVDYALGFCVATALLHAAGIGIGLVLGSGAGSRGKAGLLVSRAIGGATAIAGVTLMLG